MSQPIPEISEMMIKPEPNSKSFLKVCAWGAGAIALVGVAVSPQTNQFVDNQLIKARTSDMEALASAIENGDFDGMNRIEILKNTVLPPGPSLYEKIKGLNLINFENEQAVAGHVCGMAIGTIGLDGMSEAEMGQIRATVVKDPETATDICLDVVEGSGTDIVNLPIGDEYTIQALAAY